MPLNQQTELGHVNLKVSFSVPSSTGKATNSAVCSKSSEVMADK